MASLAVKDVALFLRYRIIAVRYLGKLVRTVLRLGARRAASSAPRSTAEARGVREAGLVSGPSIASDLLAEMQAKYQPRAKTVVPRERGHPFTNLWTADDIDAADPVFRFALSPEVLDVAHDYFAGRFLFETIQVLYSWPTAGALRDSQKWHRDYGDSRSLHVIAYLNDVDDEDGGPFTYIDREATKRIAARPYIRRIDDERFRRELGDAPIHAFYGNAGQSVIVDPANCYHFGSRCKRPRLAVFVTFSTETPFAPLSSPLNGRGALAAREAAKVRVDLEPGYLQQIFKA